MKPRSRWEDALNQLRQMPSTQEMALTTQKVERFKHKLLDNSSEGLSPNKAQVFRSFALDAFTHLRSKLEADLE
jgi:hypothetical protein